MWLDELNRLTGGLIRAEGSRILCGDGRVRRVHGSVTPALRVPGQFRGRASWQHAPYSTAVECGAFWVPQYRSVASGFSPHAIAAWSVEPWLEQRTTFPNWNPAGYSFYRGCRRDWIWLINPRTIACGIAFPMARDFASQALVTWRRVPGGGGVDARNVDDYINRAWAYWIGHEADYASQRYGGFRVSDIVRTLAVTSFRAPWRGMTDRLARRTSIEWTGLEDTIATAIHEAVHWGTSRVGFAHEPPGEEEAAERYGKAAARAVMVMYRGGHGERAHGKTYS